MAQKATAGQIKVTCNVYNDRKVTYLKIDLNLGPYSCESHLTLGFFRNFKMRNSVSAEFRKSLF